MNQATHDHSAGARIGVLVALALVTLAACDDGDVAGPGSQPDLATSMTEIAFQDTDPLLEVSQTSTVMIRNDGAGTLRVSSIELAGEEPEAFQVAGAQQVQLAAGESHDVTVTFMPPDLGTFGATLAIESDGGSVDLSVSGRAVRFAYEQVDRKGIPALNTVFNHPSGIGPFDKTAYNTAAPANDVASYRDLFVTVLEATGNSNEDAQAIADLLLPDELPVALGAETTAFADLNGRALADDATDVALAVTVPNSDLQSDHVDSNDKSFLSEFPYLAEPHGSE